MPRNPFDFRTSQSPRLARQARKERPSAEDRSSRLASLAAAATLLLGVLTAGAPAFSATSSTHYDDLSLFTHVLTLVRGNYVEPVDEHDLLVVAFLQLIEYVVLIVRRVVLHGGRAIVPGLGRVNCPGQRAASAGPGLSR